MTGSGQSVKRIKLKIYTEVSSLTPALTDSVAKDGPDADNNRAKNKQKKREENPLRQQINQPAFYIYQKMVEPEIAPDTMSG